MTRKAPPKKAKKAKKPATPKAAKVYIVVRTMVSVNESYTEPDRAFASRAAADEYAGRLNRELRALTNPFDDELFPEDVMSGGEDDFAALLGRLGVTAPKVKRGDSFINWAAWWDRSYFDLTDAQRDAIWDALDEFEWYKVMQVTLGG